MELSDQRISYETIVMTSIFPQTIQIATYTYLEGIARGTLTGSLSLGASSISMLRL